MKTMSGERLARGAFGAVRVYGKKGSAEGTERSIGIYTNEKDNQREKRQSM